MLFREAKAAAASQGESLKTFLTHAVEAVLRQHRGSGKRERVILPLFGDPHGPQARLTNEDLARIEADEDVEYARRTSSRS